MTGLNTITKCYCGYIYWSPWVTRLHYSFFSPVVIVECLREVVRQEISNDNHDNLEYLVIIDGSPWNHICFRFNVLVYFLDDLSTLILGFSILCSYRWSPVSFEHLWCLTKIIPFSPFINPSPKDFEILKYDIIVGPCPVMAMVVVDLKTDGVKNKL